MGFTHVGEDYSLLTGSFYVFNIIVGTGALALPLLFAQSGVLLGTGFIAIVALLCIVGATFVVESVSVCNAVYDEHVRNKKDERRASLLRSGVRDGGDGGYGSGGVGGSADDDRARALLDEALADGGSGSSEKQQLLARRSQADLRELDFTITRLCEYGTLAEVLFPYDWGPILINFIFACYLFGDLAIYAVLVPTTLQATAPIDGKERYGAGFRIYLLCFAAVTVPFVFFNIQKTKYLQMFTTATRYAYFGLVFVLASLYIAKVCLS